MDTETTIYFTFLHNIPPPTKTNT